MVVGSLRVWDLFIVCFVLSKELPAGGKISESGEIASGGEQSGWGLSSEYSKMSIFKKQSVNTVVYINAGGAGAIAAMR